jgi:outer membrane protein OmpA-like peptidoglycan-associated protein
MTMLETASQIAGRRRRLSPDGGLTRLTMILLAGVAGLPLAACSVPDSLNPVEWYRDTTGLSKNDPGPDAPNTKNLEAGGQQDFPTLASVPPAPTRALSTEEREALTQHLLADRANAKYIDEQLRVGPASASAPPPARAATEPATSPAAVAVDAAPAAAPRTAVAQTPLPPPAAPAPAEVAEATPQESSLTTPEVTNLPQPETPRSPPPPPPADLVAGGQAPAEPAPPPPARPAPVPVPPPAPVATPAAPPAAAPPPAPARQAAQLASLPPAAAPTGGGAAPVAQITFANNSTRLSAADERTLDEVVPMQQRSGGAVRVVGYAEGRGAGVAQQLASFKMVLDRANAVAAALRNAGVEPNRILVEAAPPTSETGVMAQRAEIFLVN